MTERLVLDDFNYFGGKHCQTTALMGGLRYHDLEISEDMLLGLGGISFIYWYMKMMPAPFVGGRAGGRREEFLINICNRIGGSAKLWETKSEKKGYEKLKEILRAGEPVYTFGDMAYLPYLALPEEAHFGAHTFSVYGLDEEKNEVFVCDRANKGLTIAIDNLNKARNSKHPPFPPLNRLVLIEYPSKIGDLAPGIRAAIKETYNSMLNPPIKNFGLEGIKKWSKMVLKWPKDFKGMNMVGCLFNVFIFIEIGGTGGSAFRPMYSRFLRNASEILNESKLVDVAELYEASGRAWSEIAELALPDDWPALKGIKELAVEKNEVFEQLPPGALKRMLEINDESSKLMHQAAKELNKKDLMPMMNELKEKILVLHDKEETAIRKLNEVISK